VAKNYLEAIGVTGGGLMKLTTNYNCPMTFIRRMAFSMALPI